MKIAISGAGIAGLALAHLLHKSKNDVIVFEKSAQFSKSGYGLSLKSFGIKIMDELGLLDDLQNHALPISTFNIYQSNGKLIRSIPKAVIDKMTHGSIAVGRFDLHKILYDAVKDDVPVTFNKYICSIDHLTDAELVTFNNGDQEKFDLVVVAEGIHSSSRKLLFGSSGWSPFDIGYTATVIHRQHDFDSGQAYTFRGTGKTIAFFPVRNDKVVMQAYFRKTLKSDEVKFQLCQIFDEFSQPVKRLIAGLDDEDNIFHDSVAMVELPAITQARVALMGDAAYCPTFLSGMGASLSLLGAKVLSETLQASENIRTALLNYNNKMLPIARHFQQNARSNMNRELPKNNFHASLTNLMMRIIPFSVMIKSVSKQLTIEKSLLQV